MQIRLTRSVFSNLLLIGTLALSIGSLYAQPAAAQLNRSNFRELAEELDLSRSQMREIGGIMRGFNAELQEILTAEQYESLQAARAQQADADGRDPEALKASLNLTDEQSSQIASARTELVAGLEDVLTPEQIERMIEIAGFDQL